MTRKKRKAGTSPAKNDPVADGNEKKKKKDQTVAPSGCTSASFRDAETATNVSDVGDFGGSVENLDAAALPKRIKLPPLVVKNVPLQKLIGDFSSLGLKAEYEIRGVGVKVHLSSKVDFELASASLKNTNVEFYTHDLPGEKPFKAVMRGLPGYDPDLIKKELAERYKLAPLAVHRIRRKDELEKQYAYCLFLVHFPKGTVTMNALQAVRSLFHIRIRWEPYRGGRRDVTQCQRCLHFGHGTRNCNLQPRCKLCAESHSTANCPGNGAGITEAKCANCGGNHEGSDRRCPKRATFIRIRKEASTTNQPGRHRKPPPANTPAQYPPLQPRHVVPLLAPLPLPRTNQDTRGKTAAINSRDPRGKTAALSNQDPRGKPATVNNQDTRGKSAAKFSAQPRLAAAAAAEQDQDLPPAPGYIPPPGLSYAGVAAGFVADPVDPSNEADLLSPEVLNEIATAVFTISMTCRTRSQQLAALAAFINSRLH